MANKWNNSYLVFLLLTLKAPQLRASESDENSVPNV